MDCQGQGQNWAQCHCGGSVLIMPLYYSFCTPGIHETCSNSSGYFLSWYFSAAAYFSMVLIIYICHSRFGLENKSGRIFCVRHVYFTKSCQQVWGRVNQPFILFVHHIWGETVPWGAVLSYRPRTECSISQFCNTNCTHSRFRMIKARVCFYRNH